MHYEAEFFFAAFESVVEGRPCTIPRFVTAEYVRRAEDIADISYAQSETFSSVCIFPLKYHIWLKFQL